MSTITRQPTTEPRSGSGGISPPASVPVISPADPASTQAQDRLLLRAELRRLQLRGLGTVLLGLVVTLPLLVPDMARSFYLRGPGLLLVALVLGWIWLHRHVLAQIARLRVDLRDPASMTVQGVASLLLSRAPGLLAPTRQSLLVGDQRFVVTGHAPEHLGLGLWVQARYAARSRVLLEVRRLDEAPAVATVAASAAITLTATEHRLLELLQAGLDDKRIARALELAPSTIRTYNAALFRKLGVRRRQEAVRRAAELGIWMSIDNN